jgi:uncharacterized protein
MPHLRNRYITPHIRKALSHSSIVGILGQRQVGKTTVATALAEDYVTFDREKDLALASADPELFLSRAWKFPLGIDEAQLCPRLFPALKEDVRVHRRPGRFILSGSVRFTSRKAIRESLTGRIVFSEILPLTWSEARELPMSQHFSKLLRCENRRHLETYLGALPLRGLRDVESYLETGGLPGICFFRNHSIRAEKFESHLDTLLNRDIRLIFNTTLLYSSLRSLLRHLAQNQGHPFNLQAASQASRISPITVKKIIFAFEALFLIRPVQAAGGARKPTYFFEDQGFASWLSEHILKDDWDICRALYANLRQELHYRPEKQGQIQHYRNKNEVVVPLVLKSPQGMLGVIPTSEKQLSPKTLGSASAFSKRFPAAKVVVAHAGTRIDMLKDGLILLPFWWLL